VKVHFQGSKREESVNFYGLKLHSNLKQNSTAHHHQIQRKLKAKQGINDIYGLNMTLDQTYGS